MEDLVTKMKALADPTRLQIIEFLKNPDTTCCTQADGVCACDFENFLGLAQPTVSHHLKQLVQAGLIKAEKRGKWVYYELQPQGFELVIEQLRSFTRQPQLHQPAPAPGSRPHG